MIHNGKVVVDNQGRVMGRNGKLLKDKAGQYYYIKKDKKKKSKDKDAAADSGETHKKNTKKDKNVSTVSASRVPFSRKNAAPADKPSMDRKGQWSADEMAAWSSATSGGKENTLTRR